MRYRNPPFALLVPARLPAGPKATNAGGCGGLAPQDVPTENSGEPQIIVAQGVTDAANDKGQLEPMVRQVEENLGAKPQRVSAHSGYYSEANVRYLREGGIDDYVCPDRLKHGEEAAPVRGRIPMDMSFIDRVRRKLLTK